MASLAQRKLRTEKRPVSAYEKLRTRTNWNAKPRPTGFSPLYTSSLVEAMRLADNAAFKILMLIWDRALGRVVPKGKPFAEITEPLAVSDIAELVHCDERTAQRELNGLVERKVIAREKLDNGVFQFQPLYKTWASLPDYKPGPVSEPAVSESDDEPETGDSAQADKQTTHVTKTPVRVVAGKKSKPYKVDCGVSALQFDVRQLDADCSAMVKDGVLLVTLEPRWNSAVGVEGLKQQKGIEENRRQICRNEPGKSADGRKRTESESTGGQSSQKGRGSQSNGKSPVQHPRAEELSVQHPRAEELSALFDPLIHRWCGKTLSGDPQALLQACIAIGETPHDIVVKAGVERGGRELKPLHMLAVCKEIEHNWRRGKGMPAGDVLPTREEIMAMAEADRKVLSEKRAAARRGRVA